MKKRYTSESNYKWIDWEILVIIPVTEIFEFRMEEL